jgi:hypothetical protein
MRKDEAIMYAKGILNQKTVINGIVADDYDLWSLADKMKKGEAYIWHSFNTQYATFLEVIA